MSKFHKLTAAFEILPNLLFTFKIVPKLLFTFLLAFILLIY